MKQAKNNHYSYGLQRVAIAGIIAIVTVDTVSADKYIGGYTVEKNTTYENESIANKSFLEGSVTSRANNKSFGGYAFVDRPNKLIVKNSDYSGLTFDGSGTVFATLVPSVTEVASLEILNTLFENNHTKYDGGVIGNYGNLTVNSSIFRGNTADYEGIDYMTPVVDSQPIGGGAIALGSSSATTLNSTITSTIFENNKSGTNGGAIGTRLGKDGDNHSATLDIDATFTGNKAYSNGGAIYNTFYANNGLNKGNGVTVKGVFTSNEAKNGGAIYNDGAQDKAGNNGGVMTITDSTFVGNKATSGWAGAIYNSGKSTITITNSIFNGNTAATAGALASGTNTINTYIENTTFENNSANEIGAVGLFSKATLKNVNFIDNKATFYVGQSKNYDDLVSSNIDGAGALFLGAVSSTNVCGVLSDSLFSGNSSEINGGAIATRRNKSGVSLNDNSAAQLDITNTVFTNNTAGTIGGAIDNYFYNSNKNSGYVTIENSEFVSNEATDGGAIYNHSETDSKNGFGKILITDTQFTNNTATINGGAIYNAGNLKLTGENVFSGNKANNLLNDIYNTGTIDVDGTLSLDGGIAGGTGTVNFVAGSNLMATLDRTTILADTVTFGENTTLNLTVSNNQANGNVAFITANTITVDDTFKIADNGLYNLNLITTSGTDKGKIAVTVKSGTELLNNTSATSQEADTISAIANTTGNGTFAGNAIAEKISVAMQTGNKTAAIKAARDLAPSTSQTIVGIAQGINNALSKVAANRMAVVGQASGDTFKGEALWIQGLYNHTEQDSSSKTDGFDANTNGISLGIDGKLAENVIFGLGYGYTNTNANAGSRDVDIEGLNVFLYSEYKPNNWYVNGMINYGVNKYIEAKSPLGIDLESKYNVNTYAVNVMTGYDFDNSLTPEVGLRYLLTEQDSYNDGIQSIKSEDTDVVTGVARIKYSQAYTAKDWMLKPSLHFGTTYDMLSDNSKSAINVIGGGCYQITGERLERLGFETGLGLEASFNDWVLSLDYSGGFRKDFQSHTVMLKAKRNF